MKIVKLKPKGNFKEIFHSDTLWGNIIFSYGIIYGEKLLIKLLDEFNSEKPPFVLSSVFLSYQLGNEQFYFFPKPITEGLSSTPQNPMEMVYLKKYKRIKYLGKKEFEEFINGKLDDDSLFNKFCNWEKEKEENKDNPNYEPEKSEFAFRFLSGVEKTFNMHNSIDRMSGSTLQKDERGQLYWEQEIFNKNDYFFLVEGEKLNLIEAPLRYLSHVGIGGNRNIGKGSFEFTVEDFKLDIPAKPGSRVLLSLFNPNEKELNYIRNNSLWYELSVRRGFMGRNPGIASTQKNLCTAFVEGSVFQFSEKIIGRLIETSKINSDSPVYSNYLAFTIPSKIQVKNEIIS